MKRKRVLIIVLTLLVAGSGMFATMRVSCCHEITTDGVYNPVSVYAGGDEIEYFLTQAPPVPSRPRCAPCNARGHMMCGSCGGTGWQTLHNERVACRTCAGNDVRVYRFCDGTGFRKQ